MTDQQNMNSTGDAVPGESLKDGAQSQAPLKDELPDDQLDMTGGGAYPVVITGYANTGIGG